MAALRKFAFVRMTVDEFLSWDPKDRSGRLWQLIDGDPVAMAPATDAHGSIQSEIIGLLRDHLLRRGSACRVVTTPGVIPRIGASRNFRIPDLGVTCAPPSRETNLPDPVLLIEILSPSNENETRANIWTYTTIPSVREILAVRSTRLEAELLRRRDDGSWPEEPDILARDASLTLDSIDFTTPLKAFYRTTELG
jgi:Uma2 family endonuclease